VANPLELHHPFLYVKYIENPFIFIA